MKTILVLLIDFYKKFISPIINVRPRCRFYPSCSSYARQAIIKYGAIKGTFLATMRLLRCNPFNDGGYDPLK